MAARELWNLAPEGTETYSHPWYIKLRYRLMPYLYALAGRVNREDYTLCGACDGFSGGPRGAEDRRPVDVRPALMPCPVSNTRPAPVPSFPGRGFLVRLLRRTADSGGQRLVDAPMRGCLCTCAQVDPSLWSEIQWSTRSPPTDRSVCVCRSGRQLHALRR